MEWIILHYWLLNLFKVTLLLSVLQICLTTNTTTDNNNRNKLILWMPHSIPPTPQMPPDVRTLQPAEARALCRFCLRPQKTGTHQPPIVARSAIDGSSVGVRSWPKCEMGLLYAQLTGGEQVDGGCLGSNREIRAHDHFHDCSSCTLPLAMEPPPTRMVPPTIRHR